MFFLWIFIVIFSIIYLAILFYLVYAIYAVASGAPYVPTSNQKVEKMLDMIKLNKDNRFIDLGSGDGRLVLQAAKRCDHAVGVEISPLLYWVSKIKQKKQRIRNATFMRDTLWNIDLREYDVVSIYFIPHWMKKLKKKIMNEMKPGSRIVSHAFVFPDWQPIAKNGNIYVYEITDESQK